MATDLVLFNDFPAAVKAARALGNESVVYASSFRENELKDLREKARKEKVRLCHIVSAANKKEVQSMRGRVEFIAVEGGSPEMNKFGAFTKGVDFLFRPVSAGKNVFDTAIARMLSDSRRPVAILFSDFLAVSGRKRSLLLKNYLFVVKLLKKFRVNALFLSGARDSSGSRSLDDLASFAVVLGFSPLQGKRFASSFNENFFGA